MKTEGRLATLEANEAITEGILTPSESKCKRTMGGKLPKQQAWGFQRRRPLTLYNLKLAGGGATFRWGNHKKNTPSYTY